MSKWGSLLPTLLFTFSKTGKLYQVNLDPTMSNSLQMQLKMWVCVCVCVCVCVVIHLALQGPWKLGTSFWEECGECGRVAIRGEFVPKLQRSLWAWWNLLSRWAHRIKPSGNADSLSFSASYELLLDVSPGLPWWVEGRTVPDISIIKRIQSFHC